MTKINSEDSKKIENNLSSNPLGLISSALISSASQFKSAPYQPITEIGKNIITNKWDGRLDCARIFNTRSLSSLSSICDNNIDVSGRPEIMSWNKNDLAKDQKSHYNTPQDSLYNLQ